MAILYSHTYEEYAGASGLPLTLQATTAPPGGTVSALVTSVEVELYKPNLNGDYTYGMKIKGLDDEYGEYSSEIVTWAGETTQRVTFTFVNEPAYLDVFSRITYYVASTAGPPRYSYMTYDDSAPAKTYAIILGSWVDETDLPEAPINPTPEHEATGITLDGTTVTWEDGGGGETYDVYFRAFGEFFEKVGSDLEVLTCQVSDRNYSYGWLHEWVVIAKNEYGSNYDPPEGFGIGYGGTVWQFNAMLFEPPLPAGVTLDYSGDPGDEGYGEPTGTPTGENNLITVRRLVAAAENKFWYEEL